MQPGDKIESLLTPRPVIDEAVMEANITRVQSYFDGIGRAFRPHVKTHKLPFVARAQLAAGARGINCQKLSEAEVFADAGFDDILITFNMMGAERLERLGTLHERVTLAVVADNAVVIDGLAEAFTSLHPLTVLVEFEGGSNRNGVQTPAEALALAQRIVASPGLRFGGLLTYPRAGHEAEVETFFTDATALLAAQGIDCPVRSHAGSPGLFQSHLVPSATEHRAGTCVYNDRATVRSGACGIEDCAMHILATVVSRPTENRAVIDAGSKTLTQDLLGFQDFGHVIEYPQARITSLSEEHGVIDLSGCTEKPQIGDVLRIIPNHTCVVTNLFDTMVFHRDGRVTRIEDVEARGTVW